jgi:hypothetical protein
MEAKIFLQKIKIMAENHWKKNQWFSSILKKFKNYMLVLVKKNPELVC